jgi:hypothetical protein
MLSTLFKRGKKQRAFQRVIAFLLLTLSFVDIVVIDVFLPELCEREGTMIAVGKVVNAISVSNEADTKQLTTANDTKHNGSSSPLTFDEDCFCCCCHILPTSHFSFPFLSLRSEQAVSVMAFLPTSPPLEMFRPPRLA